MNLKLPSCFKVMSLIKVSVLIKPLPLVIWVHSSPNKITLLLFFLYMSITTLGTGGTEGHLKAANLSSEAIGRESVERVFKLKDFVIILTRITFE